MLRKVFDLLHNSHSSVPMYADECELLVLAALSVTYWRSQKPPTVKYSFDGWRFLFTQQIQRSKCAAFRQVVCLLCKVFDLLHNSHSSVPMYADECELLVLAALSVTYRRSQKPPTVFRLAVFYTLHSITIARFIILLMPNAKCRNEGVRYAHLFKYGRSSPSHGTQRTAFPTSHPP